MHGVIKKFVIITIILIAGLAHQIIGEEKASVGAPLSQQSAEAKKQIKASFDLGTNIYVWSVEVGSKELGKPLTFALIEVSKFLGIELDPSPNTITTRKQAHSVMKSYILNQAKTKSEIEKAQGDLLKWHTRISGMIR